VLNFPDLERDLPRPASLAPRDVQAGAAISLPSRRGGGYEIEGER